MLVEQKFFGPLTFKQFIYAVTFFAIGYFTYENLSVKISLPIIIILFGIFLAIYLNSPKQIIDEDFLERKKFEINDSEKFKKELMRSIASLESQIEMTRQRGLKEKEEWVTALKLFKDFLEEENKTQ